MTRRFGRRVGTATVTAILLTLTALGLALGKCEPGSPEANNPYCLGVVATLDNGTSIQAGATTTVGMTLTQGEQPFEGSADLLVVRVGGGEPVVAPLQPSSPPGHFTAEVSLPAGGFWTAVVLARGSDGEPHEAALGTLRIADPPPGAIPSDDPVAAGRIDLVPWTWAVLATIAGGTAALILLGRRRRLSGAA